MYTAVFLALAFLCVGQAFGDVKSCMYMDPTGKTYDFKTLVNPSGYYMFSQQVWQIGDYSLDSLVADTQVNVTFYLQVCSNILAPPTGCTDPGAAYSVTPDGKCISWGDINVATFDPNPYQDGANIKMYHGSAVDHLANYNSILYFVCDEGKNGLRATVPSFEHVKAPLNQAHFKIVTNLAC
ncbi:uncharacterized protein LOC127876061 [Dreissena polymorpha]|uniref:Uncharacterized protein n=1 Tax=Dreissena polymorpha TaxID=45954 RepID=A0A9D4KMQ3_DREPO|nr:uncharacterized protein LOC127876061 [Dreissena polymorpha]KAH3842097.1 hypothetical protein DPMN_115585 [Dreissena polymorpha]